MKIFCLRFDALQSRVSAVKSTKEGETLYGHNKHFTFRDISRERSRFALPGLLMHNDLNLEFRAHGAFSGGQKESSTKERKKGS